MQYKSICGGTSGQVSVSAFTPLSIWSSDARIICINWQACQLNFIHRITKQRSRLGKHSNCFTCLSCLYNPPSVSLREEMKWLSITWFSYVVAPTFIVKFCLPLIERSWLDCKIQVSMDPCRLDQFQLIGIIFETIFESDMVFV